MNNLTLMPKAEAARRLAETLRLEKDLKDLWEGCVPWSEAHQMIGAPDWALNDLWRSWRRWQRRFEGGR